MFALLRCPAAQVYFKSFISLGRLCSSYPVAYERFKPLGLSKKFFDGQVCYFHLYSLGTRNKAVLKSQKGIRRNLYWNHWKRTLFVQNRAEREEMNSIGNDSFFESQGPFLSARIQCSGTIADQLTEALMCFGANSVSIEDANSGESTEQAFSDGPVPWEPRKREFWNQCCITAIFTADQDVSKCLAFSANSIGLKEIPKYEITRGECHNWVQQVQQILYLQSASLLLSMYTVKLLNLETSSWEDFWCSQKSTIPMDPQAINIILDPGLAFGTGEHPTTRLCLLFLREFVNGGEHVLDYGTGSGILGIAALKMGAARAVGVDTDPMAVSSAKHNANLNLFGTDKMQVFLASNDGNNPLSSITMNEGMMKGHSVTATSETGPAEYDIVVANILLNPLLELASQITGYVKPGGVVGLSGIILDQVPQVQECYSQFLEKMTVAQADGWACIKGTKKFLQ